MRNARKSLRCTIPPAREPTGGANEDVSWLRAIQLAFPGYPSGIEPITTCPLQWRGRAGFAPASVSPFANERLAESRRWRSATQCPYQGEHHAAREHRDDIGQQRLRVEFSRGQLNLDQIARGEWTGAVGGELSLLDRLDAARLQLRCPDRCRRILDEQVDLGRRLIDRNDEGACPGLDRIGVAELLRLAGADRGEHHDAVIAEAHGFGRDIALPAAELSRVGGDAPGPRRPQRVPGDPCRAPK